jgi:hypothetical protein
VTTEGELTVRLSWDGARIVGTTIASTRPRGIGDVLAGRAPEAAPALIGGLFSICGHAQAVAAASACEAALGAVADSRERVGRERRVRDEIARETLIRTLLDWPRLTGGTPEASSIDTLRRLLAPGADAGEAAREAVRDAVLGAGADWSAFDAADGAERWLAGQRAPVARWLAQLGAERPTFGAADVPLLPAPAAEVARATAAALERDAAFAAAPEWSNAPAETGALARTARAPAVAALVARWGRSAFVRLMARIVELVGLVRPDVPFERPLAGSVPLGAGRGAGWVETARGLLVHVVDVAAGRIARYRIVAPTEWNFHPRGVLSAGLAGAIARSEDECRAMAALLVQSLDPCVASRIEVTRA